MKERKTRAETGAVPPLAAFAALLAVALGAAAFLIISSDPPARLPAPLPQVSDSPTDHELTDAEAIARFKELDAIRRRAYQNADPSVVAHVFAREGSTYGRVQRELQTLRADEVVSKTRFDTESLSVLENEDSEISIRQIVLIKPRFVDSEGRDVTGHSRPERKTIEWTLIWTGAQWLIGESVVTAVEPK